MRDGLGWKNPRYFSTIQTVDIDGDGQTELLARWIDGLDVYKFVNGTLLSHSRLTAFSDNAGFYQPSWYSTIQAAVLEPNLHQADIIARKNDGVHVFRYSAMLRTWSEIGQGASTRPFADSADESEGWKDPSHYLTIHLADVDGDGAAELVGRASDGMHTYRWDASNEVWRDLGVCAALSDSNAFDKEPYYSTIQFLDVDGDGSAEMIARGSAGVQTYKWSGSAWGALSSAGPFGDDEGFSIESRYLSVKTFCDRNNKAWLYGVKGDRSGSASIAIYRWSKRGWQSQPSIPLRGSGWNSEAQVATVLGADITGDAAPEFLIRSQQGLLAFTSKGNLIRSEQSLFSDQEGWSLPEQYGTLQTASAAVRERGGLSTKTLIVGRGKNGLEVYKFSAGQWQAAADPFPVYCANGSDTSPLCLAYGAVSTAALYSTNDIRSQYTQAAFTKGNWISFRSALAQATRPSNIQADAWNTVQPQILTELGYVATIRGWFTNNLTVLQNTYNRSADLLTQATSDVNLNSGSGVVSKWLEFAYDIASQLVGAIPDGGQEIQMVLSVLQNTYGALAGSGGGDVNTTVSQITTQLNAQWTATTSANAVTQTNYLTDWGQMQLMGQYPSQGGFDWSNATIDQIAQAENGAARGMQVNFFRSLLPAAWQISWTAGPSYPAAFPVDTPARYSCNFGNGVNGNPWYSQAWITTGHFIWSPALPWSTMDFVTGNSSSDLNAIWYMMLLGGDAGWDMPGEQAWYDDRGLVEWSPGSDSQLDYASLEYGYSGPSSGCLGNGSTTGIVSQNQTIGQRLTIAQQNTRSVTPEKARVLIAQLRDLRREVRDSSWDDDADRDLESPLSKAVELLGRARLPRPGNIEGSASATTPTHLLELFNQRLELGRFRTRRPDRQRFTSAAYDLIGQLESDTEQPKCVFASHSH
jgi:hypothetical protein